MLTTIHTKGGNTSRGTDDTPYRNLTKKKRGWCTVIKIENGDAENIQGMVKNTSLATIEVNGYCEMEQGDDVELLGQLYRVWRFTSEVDKGQTAKRKDYKRLTGKTTVILEG